MVGLMRDAIRSRSLRRVDSWAESTMSSESCFLRTQMSQHGMDNSTRCISFSESEGARHTRCRWGVMEVVVGYVSVASQRCDPLSHSILEFLPILHRAHLIRIIELILTPYKFIILGFRFDIFNVYL